MRQGVMWWVAVVLAGAIGCDGGDAFEDCAIDALTGAWRLSYTETDGTCGPIQDETFILGGTGDGACTEHANTISDDRCEQTLDFTCPTTDGAGTQRWVMVLEQVGEEHIAGTGTVQLDHPEGTCRSTYDLDLQAL